MTFGANLDNDSVGAEGAIAYLPQEESENSVTAYYLYHDEEGVYFDTETYFDRMEITDQCAMTGIDYSCQVTFEIQQPTTSFSMIYYDENHSEISKTDYTPEEVTDYQTFELGSEVGSVEIICYDANGSELETMTITPDNPSILWKNKRRFASICCFQIFFTGAHITFKSSSSTQPESLFSRSRAFRSRFRLWITRAASSGVYATKYFCFFIWPASFVLPLYMAGRIAANVRFSGSV